MAVRVLLVLVAFAVLCGCGQASSPVEKQEKQGGAEQAQEEKPETVTPSGSVEETTQQVAGNMPIAGVIGENVEAGSFDFRVLDYFVADQYYYLTDTYMDDVQDAFSQAGKFVVVNYSVTNTSPQTISPTPIARLHARAGDNVEVYDQSDQVVPAGRLSPELQMDEIPPRQVLVSQFIFDVPTDVEPELVAVTDEPTIYSSLDVGVVDLTDEDPQGPRPEEILALQYQYFNMTAWKQAYDLFDQGSKELSPFDQFEEYMSQPPPIAITEYSFPSVNIQGNQATIERVITQTTPDGEYQDKRTQEAVLEDEGWSIVMRDEQVKSYTSGGEETTQ